MAPMWLAEVDSVSRAATRIMLVRILSVTLLSCAGHTAAGCARGNAQQRAPMRLAASARRRRPRRGGRWTWTRSSAGTRRAVGPGYSGGKGRSPPRSPAPAQGHSSWSALPNHSRYHATPFRREDHQCKRRDSPGLFTDPRHHRACKANEFIICSGSLLPR